MSNFITPKHIPEGWRILENGEILEIGDRYFAEKAHRSDKDYINGSPDITRWDITFGNGLPLSSKLRQPYIRKITS